MSNFNEMQTAARADLETIAKGEAAGSASITVYAMRCGADTLAGIWTPSDAAALYTARFGWVNAERKRINKEEIRVPSGKSLATQVSKFRGILEIAEIFAHEKREASWVDVMSAAAFNCGHNYKKTLSSVAAVQRELAKDVTTDDVTLLGEALAAQEELEKSPAKATDAFDALVKSWDKFCEEHGQMVKDVSAKHPELASNLATMLYKYSVHLAVAEATAAAHGM